MGRKIYVEQYTPSRYTTHKNCVQIIRRISFIRFLFLKISGSRDVYVIKN